MSCPNCGNKQPAVIVYGYCEDENGNEYPFDPRVYESGGSLPNWGEDRGKFHDYWPTRFCYECRARFAYVSEDSAFQMEYEEALRIAEEQYGKYTEQLC